MKSNKLKIIKGGLKDLDTVYIQLQKTFPPNEYKKKEAFSKLMEDGSYDLLLAISETTKSPIGYSFVYRAQETKMLWLDFISILSHQRSKGYGSLFFNAILAFYQEFYHGIFLEVEIPNGKDLNQERRITYYNRLGAHILKLNYALPTDDGAFDMHLMYKDITGNSISPNKQVTMETIKSAFEYIHRDLPHRFSVYNNIK